MLSAHSSYLKKQLSRPDSALHQHTHTTHNHRSRYDRDAAESSSSNNGYAQASTSSSAALNENFCQIGTPLPDILSNKRDENEYKPLWEQTVTDDRGRRRLHGAFTGGFSAGYYNTVGSKEGWSSSATFKSSRTQRQTLKPDQRSAEQYMDEEDLQSIRDSRQLKTKAGYGSDDAVAAGRTAEVLDQTNHTDVLSGYLEGLVGNAERMNGDIGQKLLRRMGWKVGQGLGPRISADKRRRLDPKDEVINLGVEAELHTFARPDVPLLSYTRKKNPHGLGYIEKANLYQQNTPDQRFAHSDQSKLRQQDKAKRPQLSEGFGLGALNDPDEDDLDIYEPVFGGTASNTLVAGEHYHQSRSNFISAVERDGRRIAFDEELDDSAGNKRNHIRPKSSTTIQPTKNSAKSRQSWKDGRLLPPDFVLSITVLLPRSTTSSNKHPPLPPGWKPDPNRVWKLDDKLAITETVQSRKLDADERGRLLGEASASVVKFLYQKGQERMKLSSSTNDTADTNLMAVQTIAQQIQIPYLNQQVAATALRGFIPFGDDILKQSRYRAYLTAIANRIAYKPLPAANQTVQQMNEELESFVKAAVVFKPMSSSIASRFATASDVSTTSAANASAASFGGLLPRASVEALAVEEQKKQEAIRQKEVHLTVKDIAVRNGNFGKLTRERINVYPMRLLCKRFNIAEPHPDGPPEQDRLAVASNAWRDAGLGEINVPPIPPSSTIDTDNSTGGTGPNNNQQYTYVHGQAHTSAKSTTTAVEQVVNALGMGTDERQGKNTLAYKRPSIDIFEAIFGTDSTEDEDEDEGDAAAAANPSANTSKFLSAPLKSHLGPSTSKELSRVVPNTKPSSTATTDTESGALYDDPKAITDSEDMLVRPAFISKAKRHKGGLQNNDFVTKDNFSSPNQHSHPNKRQVNGKVKSILTFDLNDDDGGGGGGDGDYAPMLPPAAALSKKIRSSHNSIGRQSSTKHDLARNDYSNKSTHGTAEQEDGGEDEWIEKKTTLQNPTNMPMLVEHDLARKRRAIAADYL